MIQFDTRGPVRIMDSRSGLGLPYGCVCEHGLMPDIVPGDNVPANATAMFVNLTVVAAEPSTFGYVTVEAGAAPGQGTSTVNWDRPGVYSNMALVPINSGLALGGAKHARLNFQGSGRIEVVVDLLGWIVPA